MQSPSHSERFLVAAFLLLLFVVPISQAVIEWRRGDSVQALQILRTRPKAKELRAYEHNLEDASFWAAALRPLAQFARWTWLRDGGEKAIIGREGWLFYGPGVRYVTERPGLSPQPGAGDAASAIIDFRDQLRARGIQLVVVPAPNKESVYPEMLTARGAGVPIPSTETRNLLRLLKTAEVEVVDLFEVFARAKMTGGDRLYLRQDSHWSPAGLELAAKAVADSVVGTGCVKRGNVHYLTRSAQISRTGDILKMLQVPALENNTVPEVVVCRQVFEPAGQQTYRDSPDSPVLVLGDSFLRVFQTDEPGGAGFTSHLARELGQPVTSLISDGGASTVVRQEVYRRADLLKGKKLVVWEFVERDIRLGTEGWQNVPLP